MKNRILFSLLFAGSFAIFFSSCSKDPLNNLSSEESRIYITNYDSTINFSNYKTFSIVDSVAVVSNNGQQSSREINNGDALLLRKITSLMEQRGYTLVDKSANPDLAINVTHVTNTYSGVNVYYPGYWDDPDYGYWDPYYWGYPGYDYYFPQYYSYYQYNQDYITIDMLDLMNAQKNNNQIIAVWNAQFKGEDVAAAGNVQNEVQAVFDQSPYLSAHN